MILEWKLLICPSGMVIYRPCYLSAASAELAWVGQEGFIDFLKGLN